MTNMKFTLLMAKCQCFLVFISTLSVVQSNTFPDIAAIVNGPVTLPCNCSGQKVEWSIFHPTKASIAVCDHAMCQINKDFQGRISVPGSPNSSIGDFSMSISSAHYNDAGFYKCTCNAQSVSEGKLKVYVPWIVSVSEGENISLPCYADTRRDAKDVQWNKNGERLLEYHNANDEASSGRLTLTKERYKRGDLSLYISSAQVSDAGFYLCRVHGESREGEPRAVQLKVEKHQPEQQPPSDFYCNIAVGVAVVVAVILVISNSIRVIAYGVRRYKGSQHTTQKDVGAPVQEEFQLVPKNSSTQPICD